MAPSVSESFFWYIAAISFITRYSYLDFVVVQIYFFSIAFKSTDRARCSYFYNHAQSNDAMTMYNLLFCSMGLVVMIVGSFVFFGILGKEATAILGFVIYILRLYVRPTINPCLCSVLDILCGCQLKMRYLMCLKYHL